VTRHPTAEWLAQQIVEAFPWNTAPTYLVRDNDGAYGQVFTTRIRTMGIRDRPISPRSPWQNPYAERLIGTLRRDCLDHVLILGERHLQRVLTLYARYYNETRTLSGSGSNARCLIGSKGRATMVPSERSRDTIIEVGHGAADELLRPKDRFETWVRLGQMFAEGKRWAARSQKAVT
jgi:hypothetical protein